MIVTHFTACVHNSYGMNCLEIDNKKSAKYIVIVFVRTAKWHQSGTSRTGRSSRKNAWSSYGDNPIQPWMVSTTMSVYQLVSMGYQVTVQSLWEHSMENSWSCRGRKLYTYSKAQKFDVNRQLDNDIRINFWKV